LLGAVPTAIPHVQGAPRLGWALAADGHLVPVHALAWRTGAPRCPWDQTVRSALDWLHSPNRILGLSPHLLPFVGTTPPIVGPALPLEPRLGAVEQGLKSGPASAASKLDDLAELLALADRPPGPDERLHATVLAHGEDRAPALAQIAAQSLFYGADAE